MSVLSFLSPDEARLESGFAPRAVSPLARALTDAEGIRDLSLLGKLEVRGAVDSVDVEAEVIPITPSRTVVVCEPDRCAALRESLPGTVIDFTGALAGIEVEGETLMRRLTDLDLDALPAAGQVGGVAALVSRDGGRFRIFFPHEYGDSVVETVRDIRAGIS